MLVRGVKSQLFRLAKGSARGLGIDIQKIPDLHNDIRRLQSIQDLGGKLSAAQELVRKHPGNPKSHFELAKCLHQSADPREFEQFERFGKVRQDWLRETGLDDLGMEFVPRGIVTGSFGNLYALEILIRANHLGLRSARKLILLLPPGSRARNPSLFGYFEPYLNVIRDDETIRALRDLESLLALPLGYCLPMDDGCSFLDFPTNRVEMAIVEQKREKALFTLTDEHRKMGDQALRELGLPPDAWYVTLHVRQSGYHGEKSDNTSQDFRNANPKDYRDAIELIVREGGWVFRLGDPSMTPLPKMPQVIDYAHHPIRSDWMDVFLGATCRFLIGTASGPLQIPRLFGGRVIFTNCAYALPYYGLRSEDLYLPRLLRRTSDGSLLSFSEMLSPPTSTYWLTEQYARAGLQWVENSPDDLTAATAEMLERTTNSGSKTSRDDNLQRRFKKIAEECGIKYDGRPVKAFMPISRDFLNRHANLL
jgi:putative glycosyltransferase (TIGR04372 family)